MRIGLIDVDGHNFPNIPLMKLSAYHKNLGDHVEWFEPMFSGHMDVVYISKVFADSKDYAYYIDADAVIKGGTGYAIHTEGEREIYNHSMDISLPHEVEHIMPDYSIYGITDTAYGFLTRGCPRGCSFCIVKEKEGSCSHKVADLAEFWNGQKNIVLCDPNILACREWKELLDQLIESRAVVDFNQGLDIRMMAKDKAEALNRIKVKKLHFAWDRYGDKELIVPLLEEFRSVSKVSPKRVIVYVLCNYNTTLDQDLERIYTLRNIGFSPYVMLYNKSLLESGHVLRQLQRWCNNRTIFWSCEKFEDYKRR